VSGCIVGHANNVTIRRTRVRGAPCDHTHQIDIGYGTYSGLVIEDVEIDGLNANAFGAGIGNNNFLCRRCNIHHVGQGASIGSNVTIVDSWIHDLAYSPDNGGSHNEPIVALGGASNVTLKNNNLEIDASHRGASASLALYNAYGPLNNFTVEGNVFNGGSYCLYAGYTHGANPVTNMRFVNNRFGRAEFARCGRYGPLTGYRSGGGNVWSGNVWDDTGAPV
jgi:hypothetical protein